jgi:hypothetical protein
MQSVTVRMVGVGVMMAVAAAACSSSPSDEVLAFCDTFVAVEASFSGEPDPAELGALLDDLDSSAPSEVAGDVATMTAAARGVLETGDFTAFESDEFASAEDAVDGYMVDECGYEQAAVTAVNYAYEDAPTTIDAGTVAITLTNEGTELHEIAIVRRNDDVTLGFEELLALPEDEAMAMVSLHGIEFQEPGNSGTTFVDLDAGDYAFICFIPVGATPENLPALMSGEFEGGPPHFTVGMVHEFTVEGE